MLKLNVSTSNSIWCECTGEWVLRVLHLISFQAVIRLSLLGRREGFLQLCSQSLPWGWMWCASPCACLCLALGIGGFWRRAVPLPSSCSFPAGITTLSPEGTVISVGCCHSSTVAWMFWAMNDSSGGSYKGLCGRQPSYSRHSSRMLLQVGRTCSQQFNNLPWTRWPVLCCCILSNSWKIPPGNLILVWEDMEGCLSQYLPGRRSSLSLDWRVFLGTGARAWKHSLRLQTQVASF